MVVLGLGFGVQAEKFFLGLDTVRPWPWSWAWRCSSDNLHWISSFLKCNRSQQIELVLTLASALSVVYIWRTLRGQALLFFLCAPVSLPRKVSWKYRVGFRPVFSSCYCGPGFGLDISGPVNFPASAHTGPTATLTHSETRSFASAN